MERSIGQGASPSRRPVGGARASARARGLHTVALAATVAAALAAALAAPQACAQQRAPAGPDSWTGSDKALHAGLSAPFGALGATLAPRDAGTGQRVLYGATLGALPGLAKELADIGRPGATASMRDMAFNVLGAAFGALVADCCLIRTFARGDRVDGIGVEYRIEF